MNRPKFLFYLLGFLVLGAGIVWAGTTTLTTYYPAPTGNYNQLTSNYVSIGTSTMGQALVVMPAAGNNGNVGIGTTGPLYLLDAQKTPAANSASIRFAGDDTWGQCGVGSCDGAQLFITGISNPNLHLAIGMDTTNKFGFIRATEAGVAVHNLILQPDAGSVGIGVTSPGTKLEVDGTNSSLLRIFNTAGTGTDFGMLDNIWQAHIVQNSGNLIFQIGGTSEAMRITSGGNVGIGITA